MAWNSVTALDKLVAGEVKNYLDCLYIVVLRNQFYKSLKKIPLPTKFSIRIVCRFKETSL